MNASTTLESGLKTADRPFAGSIRRKQNRRTTHGRQSVSKASVVTGIMFLLMAVGVAAWVLLKAI
jgi:hypothetical protein